MYNATSKLPFLLCKLEILIWQELQSLYQASDGQFFRVAKVLQEGTLKTG
jgi:hypothetical protein